MQCKIYDICAISKRQSLQQHYSAPPCHQFHVLSVWSYGVLCCAVLCKGNEMYQIQFLLSLNILRFTIISPFSCNCAGVKTVARPHGEARGRGGQHRRHHPHGDKRSSHPPVTQFPWPATPPPPRPPPRRTQGGETRNQFVTRLAAACLSDVGAWSSLTSTRLGRERSHLSRDTMHSIQTPGCPPVLQCCVVMTIHI